MVTWGFLKDFLSYKFKECLPRITRFFRKNWTTLAKWVGYLLICKILFNYGDLPSNPDVKQIYDIVKIIGFVAIPVYPLFSLILRKTPSFICFSRSMRGLLIYSVAMWLMRYLGDLLYNLLLRFPRQSATFAVAFAVSLIIFLLSFLYKDTLARETSQINDAGPDSEAFGKKATSLDFRHASVHESGHALVLAAFAKYPLQIEIILHNRLDDNGNLGFLKYKVDEGILFEKTYAEWDMLSLLAGKQGETALIGETAHGSYKDLDKWLRRAKKYLSEHYRGIYYNDPASDYEDKRNEIMLEELKAEQIGMLNLMFEMNIDVLKEISEKLFLKKILARG